jgi:dTDP-4-dehydrorhamnose 3,5-epimerase
MTMNVIPTGLDGVVIIEPDVFGDHRGFFMETYQGERYRNAGIRPGFVQDNLSFSVKNTLRGLHYQISRSQAKLVQVITGEIFDVVVDIRSGSSTFGQWLGVRLSEKNRHQLFIPAGFAHGFCVLSEAAHFMYKCSDYYLPEDEGGILWSDSTIGINWPISAPIISDKDACFAPLADIPPERLPIIGSEPKPTSG